MFALLDCNNFFASCERIFRPELEDKPVLVLSNNDGCVIARSQEVKDLGIKMGVPFFECKDIVEKNNVNVFSTNFALYGDMSNRVMSILRKSAPSVEVYSIDEAFMLLSEMEIKNYRDFCLNIRAKIQKWVGIPVSIGIAPTKTLAKLVNHIAKKTPEMNGVMDVSDYTENEMDKMLEKTEVIEIWGVGRKTALYLNSIGVYNAKQLKYLDPIYIKKHLGVLGERLILELNGTKCIKLELGKDKKGISCTRTFADPVHSFDELCNNIVSYAERAAVKLRHQNSVANLVNVFVRASRYGGSGYYWNSYTISLPYACFYTPLISKYAKIALKKIFIKGLPYKQAGVTLMGIESAQVMQYDMIYPDKEQRRTRDLKLMKAVDKINNDFGADTIKIAADGFKTVSFAKQESRSPRYTSRWNELLTIKI